MGNDYLPKKKVCRDCTPCVASSGEVGAKASLKRGADMEAPLAVD